MAKLQMQKQEHFVRLRAAVYQSEAFRTLPDSALKLWIDLRTKFYGHNNGDLTITLRTMKFRGWNSNSKLTRAREALLKRGLIRRTKYCGPNVFHRASRYAFTDENIARNDEVGVAGASASHEYLNWTRNTVISAHPRKVTNGTIKRTATGLDKGERTLETAPAEGQPHILNKVLPTKALLPNVADSPRSPAEGHISSSTRHRLEEAATTTRCPAPWEAE